MNHANEQNPSYLLGHLVSMVQKMENAQMENSISNSPWGEEMLLLFQANLESTMSILVKTIQNLPETVRTPQGVALQRSHIELSLKSIDFNFFDQNPLCPLGYQACFAGKSLEEWQKSNENAGQTPPPPPPAQVAKVNSDIPQEKDQHSRYLGEFMAYFHCMERGKGIIPPYEGQNQGEDSYLLFEMNFQNAWRLVQTGIPILPESVQFRGQELTMDQLKEAFQRLNHDKLTAGTLHKEGFLQGYQAILEKF